MKLLIFFYFVHLKLSQLPAAHGFQAKINFGSFKFEPHNGMQKNRMRYF